MSRGKVDEVWCECGNLLTTKDLVAHRRKCLPCSKAYVAEKVMALMRRIINDSKGQ